LNARAETDDSKHAIQCVVRSKPGENFLRLEAVARSSTAASGQYDLSILKSSATGTSQNHQSGSFVLTANNDVVLTTVILDASAKGHVQASLSLQSEIGSASCKSP
jgi:hypothetical protein